MNVRVYWLSTGIPWQDLPERFGISDGRNSRSARDEVKVLDLTCFLLYNYYVRIAVEIYISVPGFSRSQFKSERGGTHFGQENR